jgi:hypothetical protein
MNMDKHELERRLRLDAAKLPVSSHSSLLQRISAALSQQPPRQHGGTSRSGFWSDLRHAQTQSLPRKLLQTVAISVPIAAALALLLFSLQLSSPLHQTNVDEAMPMLTSSTPGTIQQHLQQQLISNEQALWQELERIDHDLDKTRQAIGLTRVMK